MHSAAQTAQSTYDDGRNGEAPQNGATGRRRKNRFGRMRSRCGSLDTTCRIGRCRTRSFSPIPLRIAQVRLAKRRFDKVNRFRTLDTLLSMKSAAAQASCVAGPRSDAPVNGAGSTFSRVKCHPRRPRRHYSPGRWSHRSPAHPAAPLRAFLDPYASGLCWRGDRWVGGRAERGPSASRGTATRRRRVQPTRTSFTSSPHRC